jgi:hypothetical protein
MAIVIFARPKAEGQRQATQLNTLLVLLVGVASLLSVMFLSTQPVGAKEGQRTIIAKKAGYPEGPVFIGNDLYYTEMTRNRVMKVSSEALKKKQ